MASEVEVSCSTTEVIICIGRLQLHRKVNGCMHVAPGKGEGLYFHRAHGRM